MAQYGIDLHNRKKKDHSTAAVRCAEGGRMRLGRHAGDRHNSSRPGRHRFVRMPRRPLGRITWGVSLASAAAAVILMTTPTAGGAARTADRLAAAATTLSRRAPDAPPTLVGGHAFSGTPAVGALFTVSSGRLGQHFCTASVVESPVRDLVITAAHCVSRLAPDHIAFVPGFHAGLTPYGVWDVTKVVTDSAWHSSASPDHDVAFLLVSRAGSSQQIQDVTGGERLGTGWAARALARVVGYPDSTSRPITCQGRTRPFGAHEMEFDCGGYTAGTSGGPFLGKVSAATGLGTVIGVIGGYEQGGYIASVSYSPRFGSAVQALFQDAVSQG
jgi:V8-like Glu-specific endopeptidase